MPAKVAVRLTVNGVAWSGEIDPRTTLLRLLRDHVGLTGTNPGCERGECGACTVLRDDRPVPSCLTLAASADGSAIVTIEGLASPDGTLHPVQQAFIDHDALQCGFCTPGQIIAAVACLTAGKAGSDDEVREWMSGNLCRCAAYPQIVAAIRSLAPAPGSGAPGGAPAASGARGLRVDGPASASGPPPPADAR